MKSLVKITVSLFLLISFNSYSQKGNYFIHNYLPAQYHAADQNRCVLQDMYGRIFVANNNGLLINNGSEWDILDLPFLCLSLGKNEGEEVFIGGDGNFGKLIQLENGKYKFESLIHLIPKNDEDPGKFWSVIAIKNHIYFCSNQKIYDYDYKTIKTISPGEEGFHTFFESEQHLLVREKGVGLKILSYNNEFTLLKDGAQFADNNNPVRGIIKGDNYHYIITPGGIYRFNFNKTLPELSTIEKINTPVNNWLYEKTVYCAANIGENNYAFGSVNGGVVITDKEFKPVKFINTDNDLQDDGVNYIYNDNQGHIWLALAKGISLIEFNSPITKFTKSDGISGTIEACTFFNGTPYLATDKGILKYNSDNLKFETTNITDAAWCISEASAQLLAGTKSGVYILEKNEFKLILETGWAVHCIFVHPFKKGLVYIGTETGYAKGILNDKKITISKSYFDLNADIRTIAISNTNDVCFGTVESGIFVEAADKEPVQLSEKEGLQSLYENYLFNYNNDVLVATDYGISKLDFKKEKYSIAPDERFSLLNNKYNVFKAITINKNIWLTGKPDVKSGKASEVLLCLENGNGNFKIKHTQLSRIKESDTKSFCYLGSYVYIGTNNGLYCYDLGLQNPRFGLNTFVNNFQLGTDTALSFYNITPRTILEGLKINYNNNSIQIALGASDYIDKNELLFSYYMEGRDTSYSTYSNSKNIRFDHLREGDYVFHVKSKNILGLEGQEIKIPFIILPPWHRTIWAYAAYVLSFLIIVYIIIKLNSKRLIEQNLRLEKIINERTKEINKQKLEIEHKNQEITDSINYAKGIQDSILPSINEIKKVWSDLFIFFQPKDIVSGDFYWFKQINKDEFLIACCDCTGHGVPGGFMSMICSDKLHDATRETTKPDEILYLANNSIKESLRQQNEGKSKDGMEICLLKINLKTREVLFSGANRHLWIIDGSSKKLNEIKPTKASIASFTEFNFKYELNTLQLNKGDILFISTDGYPDQFGGAHGKKYMSKNFKNLLIQNSHLPIKEMEIEIQSNINNWMQGYEQVDDLLVIGIRL